MSNPIWIILKTVCESILQVFLLCFVGWYLCRIRILEKKGVQRLNILNLAFFTPALLFAKVAYTLSPSQLRELWIIPVFFAIITFLSLISARILAHLSQLSEIQSDFAAAASMFGNTNSLPVALMQSMVFTVPQLRAHTEDDTSSMLGRSLTYLFLFASLGMILRYSYGIKLLEGRMEEVEAPSSPLHSRDAPTSFSEGSTLIGSEVLSNMTSHSEPPSYEGDCPDGTRPHGKLVNKGMEEPEITTSQRATRWLVSKLRVCLAISKGLMSPPLAASLISLVVAMIPPLQAFLEDYAQPLKLSITDAAECCIPLTLVVLGAYFHDPEESSTKGDGRVRVDDDNSDELCVGSPSLPGRIRGFSMSGESKTVLVAILCRMVIVPVMVLPMIYFGASSGLHEAFKDPVFVVSIVLLASAPPALTLAQIVPKSSGNIFESLISSCLFWSYCVVTPPTVILYVSVGLWISRNA